MPSFGRTAVITALLCCWVPAAHSAADDSRRQGRRIYLEARRAAGGAPLRDLSMDLQTTITTAQDQQVRFESRVEVVLPYILRQEIGTNLARITMIFDGERGRKRTAQGEQDLPAEAVRFQLAQSDRDHILFGDVPPAGAIRYRGEDTLEGRPVDVIEIADVGDTPLRLFLDRETRDLVKILYVGDVPGGGMAQVEELYSDFQTVDGIRLHGTRRVLRNGKEAVRSTASNIRVNSGLDPEELLR